MNDFDPDRLSVPSSSSTAGHSSPVPPDSVDEDDWLHDIVPDEPQVLREARRARRGDPSATPIVLVETAFLASAASLIWLLNFYFPMGPLLQIFFPVPIALIYLRWGNRPAWMAVLVSGLLLTVLMGPARSIQYTIPFGLLGVLLGSLWNRRASWGMAIFLGTILTTLGTFFRFWLVSILLGDDLWLYAMTQITGLLEWLFTRLGWLLQPNYNVIQLFAVGMIVVRNLIYLFVVHVAAVVLLDRLGTPISTPPKWVQVLFEID